MIMQPDDPGRVTSRVADRFLTRCSQLSAKMNT